MRQVMVGPYGTYNHLSDPFYRTEDPRFYGDLREAQFAWNKLCLGPVLEKLKLAVFSKTWPVGAEPGGMECHASTLYTALAARGHEIHVFTVPSDRRSHPDIHDGPNVAVTWHGIWYEIMHSKLFEQLLSDPQGLRTGSDTELRDAVPRLVDEIKFFSSYTQHICISNSAGEVLKNIYQHPRKNVHVILNGDDEAKFVYDQDACAGFRKQHGVPSNASVVMGVAGRLVRDKRHPLLYESFLLISENYLGVFLLVAGTGPWGKRHAELGSNVKVLGALEPSQLSEF
ncbi:Udp-glycosyltransferase superfamily protein [Thalictrum thalictroides]|uniref:Udp-glycosyltransferase superfamily protein n=1 Tax=Thalictrum thalictroides TaxID=46969 RepID=A0A7J6WG69_THATH|nr:Udp-glycosyltransferase superfamily protein [Thalictrum thalictroides]